MKPLLHPKFRLNGKIFSSSETLKIAAKHLLKNDGKEEAFIGKFILEWLNKSDFIRVNTSGSTGTPKTIKLQKIHVQNSAKATVKYFNLNEGTRALLCLPSEYIAGKMMLVRAMISGWDLYTTSPEKNPLENFEKEFDFTAMVPYQVHHSLSQLHKVKKLIVGGGAVSKNLEHQIQQLEINVFATYGMTETISHIAIRRLNGNNRSPVYSALPRVKFSQNENGCLQISAPTISEEMVVTNDVVDLLSATSFKLLGRIDNVINSGGVKIHPEIVEEKLAKYIQEPFFITSEKDEVLGERVILVIECQDDIDFASFSSAFNELSPYEKPKRILTSLKFVYTETGKIRRNSVLKNTGDFK